MLELFQKVLVFGCLGLLIEVFFTSIGSLLRGDKKAVGTTYAYMLFLYGFAGVFFGNISDLLQWPWYAMAFVYFPLIYLMEFSYGLLLKWLIGIVPWHYGHGKYSVMGLIRLDYAPFWFILALTIDPLSQYVSRVIQLLSKVS